MAEFDVRAKCCGVAELYEPVAEDAEMRLVSRSKPALPVRGNRELIGQALANLVDNALKYGAPPEAGGRRRSPQCLTARRQGGIGGACRGRSRPRHCRQPIAPACSTVSCGSENSRSRPGSGLGLSLAAAVARLHGGRLDARGQCAGPARRHCLIGLAACKSVCEPRRPARRRETRCMHNTAPLADRRHRRAARRRAPRGQIPPRRSAPSDGARRRRVSKACWRACRRGPSPTYCSASPITRPISGASPASTRRACSGCSTLRRTRAFAACLATHRGPPATRADNEHDLMRALRLAKQETRCSIALADIGGVWDVVR
jgi:hypothetical protein